MFMTILNIASILVLLLILLILYGLIQERPHVNVTQGGGYSSCSPAPSPFGEKKSLSHFEQQEKEIEEFTKQRMETMADIRAGRAWNGTNGVWM